MENYNDILDILIKAKGKGVQFFIEGTELKIKLTKGKTLDKEFLGEIKEYKTDIYFFLENQEREKRKAKREKIVRQDYSKIDKIPLSYAQERLWFIDRLEEGSSHYNMPGIVKIHGELDVDLLTRAVRGIIDRHEVLRTVIKEENGVPYQVILDASNWKLEESVDVTGVAEGIELMDLIEEVIEKPFDLASDYMMKLVLLEDNGTPRYLAFIMHHIASDGVSTDILSSELLAIYKSEYTGEPTGLPKLEVQYADYSIWQRKHLSGEVLEEQMSYWKKHLSDVPPLEIPLDFKRPEIQSTEGENHDFYLNKEKLDALNRISRANGATLFMTVLSIFKVLMYRYSGQVDFSIGTPIANREQHEIEDLIGFFINTLAIRTDLSGNPTFKEYLAQLRKNTLDAYEYQQVPFEKIVAETVGARDMSRSPIFQVLFTMQNTDEVEEEDGTNNATTLDMGNVRLEEVEFEYKISQYELSIDFCEEPNGVSVGMEYCTDLFKTETIIRMAKNFETLIDSIIENTEGKIDDLNIIPEDEMKVLLLDFNASQKDFDENLTLLDCFKDQVENRPNAVAIKFEDKEISYKQLDERSNQIAQFLKSHGVTADSLVPLCLERGIEMITSIVGVMKSGGAYVPIDPDYPEDRISYMIAKTDSTITLSSNEFVGIIQNLSNSKVETVGTGSDIWEYPKTPLDHRVSSTDLAYMIYTSGSTGMPKGTMLEHKGMLNHIFGMVDELKMSSSSKLAQNASVSFDISVWQMLAPLCIGATTVVYSKDMVLNPEEFIKSVSNEGVTVLELVPSYLSVLIDDYIPELNVDDSFLKDLEYLLITGETVKKSLVKKWFDTYPSKPMVNAYGPTEASDDITLHIMEQTPENWLIPIGKPVQNVKLYIVDKQGKLSPIGVKGEIYVSGISVGRGYYNDAEKTSQVFISDYFDPDSGHRMYKTGDIGRWLSDGTIEFYGRSDYQVKIRGHRIELQEIEHSLTSLTNVKEAVVIDFEDKNEMKFLCAYVTLTNNTDQDIDYQDLLSDKLPDYMVPSFIIPLEEFPLTPNGKIDRKGLPMPNVAEMLNEDYVAPSNEVEEKLVAIWQDLLGIDKIGVSDDFFELGGHSLHMTRMLSIIEKNFDVKLSIRVLFQYSNIEEISKQIILNTTVNDEEYEVIEF